MNNFRNLKQTEVDVLTNQRCTATNWETIFIKASTDISRIKNVSFSGVIKLGLLNGENEAFGGVVRPNGIYNSRIHNCEIGDNPFITNVQNYIANYRIGKNVIIDNVGHIAVSEISSFGNGTKVEAINEGGGREIPIYDNLSAQTAYLLSLYRHRNELISHLKEMIHNYTESVTSDTGTIGDSVKILNCRSIKNVNIGEHAKLEGLVSLKNGSINSYKEAPVYIGSGVMAENFIISSDTTVDNATILSNCFVGQGCTLDKHYSAEHSVFFANSQGFNGEACSIFAGPYTVTHHKSTLLIAGMFSFMNAGSGSNQSNHMYKLGPIHQGILERGSKTTSNSYILWPSKVGAFTLVSGRHYKNIDSSSLPFSYLIESNDESVLFPGINLRSVGTVRDAQKWGKRDKRHSDHQTDIINFNLLSPFTIHKVVEGLKILNEILELSGRNTDVFTYGGMKIKSSSLIKGMQIYNIVIQKFLGNSIISRISNKNISTTQELRNTLKPNSSIGKGKWLDVGGLLCPIESLNDVLCKIEKRKINSLNEVQAEFENLHKNYYDFEWNWAASLIEDYYKIDLNSISPEDVINIVSKWKKAVVDLDKMLYEDAKKEFSLSTQVGFGVDGNIKERELDFASVRGDFDSNTTVVEILNHIDRKTTLGENVIRKLQVIE
jgi:carbonic anhydrase/acetyltransferase-like protein (isoleucine patch superfamily)